MNDYLMERYSKHDIREFWSLLLTQKNEWKQKLETCQDDHDKAYLEGALSALTCCMEQIEKSFDLF